MLNVAEGIRKAIEKASLHLSANTFASKYDDNLLISKPNYLYANSSNDILQLLCHHLLKMTRERTQFILLFSTLEEKLSSQKDHSLEIENQRAIKNELTDTLIAFTEITRRLEEEILQNILSEERQPLSSLNSISVTLQSLITRLRDKSE